MKKQSTTVLQDQEVNMSHIKLDISKAAPFVTEQELAAMTEEALKAE